MEGGAARRWAEALGRWAIPDEIMAAAPEPPWGLPPEMFRVSVRPSPPDSASRRSALEALAALGGAAPAGRGPSVLDVGCGGGAAGMALVPPATAVTGVDQSSGMLANFAEAAVAAGVEHREVAGRWPEVAAQAGTADVVVCHHVVYNVAAIGPFVAALAAAARRRVVVELTDVHPTSPMTPLWRQFWDLDRPDEPTSDLFVEVVREAGWAPGLAHQVRPVVRGVGDDAYAAFVRRRLCLPAERQPEVSAALAALAQTSAFTSAVTTLWWDTGAG
ncbi:MAG: methyltransferase domain-containing protein [Acidimicrobiales bacterium]